MIKPALSEIANDLLVGGVLFVTGNSAASCLLREVQIRAQGIGSKVLLP
jgi:hypothetical protein